MGGPRGLLHPLLPVRTGLDSVLDSGHENHPGSFNNPISTWAIRDQLCQKLRAGAWEMRVLKAHR